MFIKVGTLVLCHIIISGSGNNAQTDKKIEKIPGIVKEITEADDIQMVDDTYAVKRKKYLLLVEPTEKDRIFQVGAEACAPVVDESTHVEMAKKKMEQKKRNEEIKLEIEAEKAAAKSPKKEVSAPKQEAKPAPTIDDKEKADLLKQLE